MQKNKIINYVKWIWVIAVFVFISVYFYNHLPETLLYFQKIPIGSLLFSILLLFLARLLIIVLALQSVKTGGWHPSFGQMFSIFSVSQLGKYIPGGIWHFAARINSYKENNLSNTRVLQTMAIESIWMVSGGVAFTTICFSLQHLRTGWTIQNAFLLSENLWRMLPWITFIIWTSGLIYIDKRFPIKEGASFPFRILLQLIIQLGVWIALGGSYFLLFIPYQLQNIWMVLGGYALSWVVGYVVPFAPGGIGVREAVQVFIFSSIATVEQLTIIAIVHRMLYTITEVILGMIGLLLARKK